VAGMSLPDWLKANNKTLDWLAEQLQISQTGASRIARGKDTRYVNLRRIYEVTDGAVTPNWMILGKAS
jgi:hypothetical protein